MRLQILSRAAGAYTPLGTSFMLLDVGEPVTTFAYTETFVSGQWYDGPPYLEKFAAAFERVVAQSLAEDESRALLQASYEEI
ncbi:MULTISPECIES: Scr1 family TA system antitoxin-like transcriptional regulator [Actinoalloteichus]|uniref:Scr1 family TA system antitoxin-like transcriptional regulator n=1 Tax=Actinoalloteichus TaxID=65496 RepID=UPI001FE20454|nr:Scr1 family TA system antitoxin-like transcriptional regulator [Actinoalloteichus caeruleus]